MNIIRNSLLAFFLATAFLGCGDAVDDEAPEINLESPENGQIFSRGATLRLLGTASDNVFVERVNLNYNNYWTTEISSTSGEFVPFDFRLVLTTITPGDIILQIIATDDSGNSTTEERTVTLVE